ncbi:chemotaxis protein CheW [Methanocaldococcus indicus]|uniref:chemotaxis protein CheW n=1 Tax=Methanocaldococcus indicus TaxID=213231 RepID=UPI003C6D029A
MTDIMEEYLDVFVEEAEEHIQTINECLLELEKNPDNLDLVNQIFRSAHTIKGGARTVGLTHISELTHHMEDILDYIRNGQIPVTSEIIDMLFKCLDALETMLEEVKSGNYETSVDFQAIIDEIQRLKAKYLEGKVDIKEEKKEEEKKEEKVEEQQETKTETTKKIKKIVVKFKNPKSVVKVKKVFKEKIEITEEEIDFNEIKGIIESIKKSLDVFYKICEVLNIENLKPLLDTIKEFIESIENEEIKLTPNVEDVLKEIMDTLERIANLLEENKDLNEIDINSLIEKIKNIKEESKTEIKEIVREEEFEVELNHEQFDLSEFGELIKQKLDEGYKLYHIKAKVEDECELKAARLAVVLARARSLGEVLVSKPTEGELKEKPSEYIEILLLSDKDLDELKKHLDGLPEIEYVAIAQVDVEIEEIEEEVKEEEIIEEEDVPDAYKVIVYLDDECLLRAVRSYMVIKELQNLGEIVKTIPPLEKIQNGEFNGTKFVVYIKLNEEYNEDDIKETVLNIPEIKDVEIYKPGEGKKEEEKKEEVKKEEKKEEKKPAAQQPKPQLKKEEKKPTTKTIRINIEKLDKLMNLVGELVITRANFAQIANKYQLKELQNAVNRLSMLINELQEEVMAMRMVPVSYVFNRFPRMVRDLAKALGKEVEFVMEGTDIELDRTVLDELAEPLVHLIRNALDHGIEPPEEREKVGKPRKGLLRLAAKRERDYVLIIVEDDGRGIDPEKIKKKAIERGLITPEEAEKMSDHEIINLIFMPGFSTAEKVSDVSGRGVGMDVVKTKIESLGGSVVVYSEKGKGTRVVLKLPLTMAIITALLMKLANQVYAIPITSVLDVTTVKQDDVKNVEGIKTIIYRDEIIPVIWLKDFLGMHHLPTRTSDDNELTVVVIEKSDGKMGLVVDDVIGREDIVVKSLTGILKNIPGLAGATILGDGRVALILDLSNA